MAASPARAPAAPRRAPRPAVRPRVVLGGGKGIRWDRVGRMGLLAVLAVITLLYVGPLHAFWSARGEAVAKRAAVTQLRQENVALRARRASLTHEGTLEAEARKLGMNRPSERTFIVRGLPDG